MDVPHHKNTRRWGGRPIRLKLPNEVAELLEHHVRWGHKMLTRVAGPLPTTLFLNVSTGAAIKPQEVSKVWSQTVLEGTGVHFGPQMCRSIHVVGTKDAGLEMHPGTAMVMGSSFETIWERVYDKQFNDRQVEAALDDMPRWREAMRRRAAAAAPAPAAPAAAAAVAAAAAAARRIPAAGGAGVGRGGEEEEEVVVVEGGEEGEEDDPEEEEDEEADLQHHQHQHQHQHEHRQHEQNAFKRQRIE
jgi:hypothetical protein